jgi:hypothetical protein
MRRVAIIAALLIIAPLFALVLLVMAQSPRKPNIAITFLGYTNSATGSRLAMFSVRNLEASPVNAWGPFIWLKTATNVIGFMQPGSTDVGGLLAAGASKVVTVPPPTNYVAWTIEVRADHDFGTWREIKCFVMYKLIALHFRPRYGNMGFSIQGRWINDAQ